MVMQNGLTIKKSVKQVKKGDKILVSGGSLATVKCLIRIPRTKSLFVLPGGLTITGRHPMRINGKWTTARQLPNAIEITNPTGFVYNFVLDKSHIPLVDGIECCTWGHGLTEAGV